MPQAEVLVPGSPSCNQLTMAGLSDGECQTVRLVPPGIPHGRCFAALLACKQPKLVPLALPCFAGLKTTMGKVLRDPLRSKCIDGLIGGSRLVLFDPDWNPANDKRE